MRFFNGLDTIVDIYISENSKLSLLPNEYKYISDGDNFIHNYHVVSCIGNICIYIGYDENSSNGLSFHPVPDGKISAIIQRNTIVIFKFR